MVTLPFPQARASLPRAHCDVARDTMESLASYEWIVICSGFLAFFTAFGIGAFFHA